jgi:hypothetical protein
MGSPLEARQSPILYNMIYFGIIIIAVIVALFLLWQLIRRVLKLPTPASRERRRRTTAADIRLAEMTYRLTAPETEFLAWLCKNYRVPNIYYFFQNAQKTYDLFADAYRDVAAAEPNSRLLTPLFSVLEKVNRHRLAISGMRNTQIIPVGQEISLLAQDKRKLTMTLRVNGEKEMRFSLPIDSPAHTVLPPELSKISIFFETRENVMVSVPVRVLTYEIRQGTEEMVTAHSTNIFSYIKQEYNYVRVNLNCTCVIAVKSSDTEAGDTQYVPDGDFVPARLIDYSGKSCNIVVTDMAPAVRQRLIVQVGLEKSWTAQFVAAVLDTADNGVSHIIHADFVQMDERTQNYILARVNGFTEQPQST